MVYMMKKELYGLVIGDAVKVQYNGGEFEGAKGHVIDIFEEDMQVELLLTGQYSGKTTIVDVRDTESL